VIAGTRVKDITEGLSASDTDANTPPLLALPSKDAVRSLLRRITAAGGWLLVNMLSLVTSEYAVTLLAAQFTDTRALPTPTLVLADPQCECVYGERGIWIVKPAALSCGRGIEVCDSLEQVTHTYPYCQQ
jgi:hypothetical protein